MPEMNLPECDYCERTDSIKKIGDTYVCPDHIKEVEKPKVDTAPIAVGDVLKQSRDIDNRVQVRTDLFNAATVAIQELKKAIDADDAIVNKPFTLALELQSRFNHFKTVIFELNEKVVEASNSQKAIQIYLNQLANSLRQEEREKLKLQDINYKPRAVKMPVNAKTIKMSKQKLDVKELRKYAAELNIPEFTLRMVAIQKGLDAKAVYELMKANIAAAKQSQ